MSVSLIVAILCVSLCGCSRPAAQRTETDGHWTRDRQRQVGSRRAMGPTTEVKEFTLVGEVRKVEKETSEVTIRHEAIPGSWKR